MLEHAGVSQLKHRVSEIFALEENVGNLENSLLLAYFQNKNIFMWQIVFYTSWIRSESCKLKNAYFEYSMTQQI